MQYFDRNSVSVPETFREDAARIERERLVEFWQQSDDYKAQNRPPKRIFEADGRVRDTLALLFKGKCAFCETRSPIHEHLFRPPEEARPIAESQFAHLYYVWLRTDWNNHYSICEICADSAYRHFPVAGEKRGLLPSQNAIRIFLDDSSGVWRDVHNDSPLLLDPCRDTDFSSHFSVDAGGKLTPTSRKGHATIETFNLNRDTLIADRRDSYDQNFTVMYGELERGDNLSVLDFDVRDHGGTWFLLLRRLVRDVLQKLERRDQITKRRIKRIIHGLWDTEIGRDAFHRAQPLLMAPKEVDEFRSPALRRGQPQLLKSVAIENFKALEAVGFQLPDPIEANERSQCPAEAAALIILGENAAGKSSVLEAIALALCDNERRTNLAKSGRKIILDPAMMATPDGTRPDQATVRLQFDVGPEHKLTITDDHQLADDKPYTPPVFAYGAFRQFGPNGRRSRKFGHVATLFWPETVLPNPEVWLLKLDVPRFSMVVRALREIMALDGEFDVLEIDRGNNRCLIVSRVGESNNFVKTPLEAASSGYRSVLAMICDIMAGLIGTSGKLIPFSELRAVILIDEIEAHLHPRWKMQIMTALRRVFPAATIIATTHDPLCLRGMYNGEVAVFARVAANPKATDLNTMVEVRTEFPDVENMTVEQLLTSDFFEMFSTDSPAVERRMAELANLLAVRASDGEAALAEEDRNILQRWETEATNALPLGNSETRRLVLEAVADFLDKRRSEHLDRINGLRDEAKKRIIAALEKS